MSKRMTFLWTMLSILVFLSSCDQDSDMAPECNYEVEPDTRFFEFLHSDGDIYYAWTNDSAVLSHVDIELSKPQSQRNQHINGIILEMPQSCSLNGEWSWYFDPDGWDLAEASIEVCDGDPDYVEENLQDYLDIERYCPWSSIVLREIEEPTWSR